VNVYRGQRPWWRTRAFGLVLAVCGYLLIIVALCAAAAAVLL
jgi:hypothetical protein